MINLIYDVEDKPPVKNLILLSIQQLLSIIAATIAVPAIVGNGMSQSAALFGAGLGTIIYLCCTKFKSPVFLSSNFSYLGAMLSAFAGGVSMSVGYLGLIIGAVLSGLVYVILSIVVKKVGVAWLDVVMPAVVIGPTVALIGLSLSSTAVSNLLKSAEVGPGGFVMTTHVWVGLICGLAALTVVIITTVFAKNFLKMIPFLMGIIAGYLVASIFTLIGVCTSNDALKILDFSGFANMKWIPEFVFAKAFSGTYEYGNLKSFWMYFFKIAVAYIPISVVSFSEHIADHKNLSSIIGRDLLTNPGLNKTLLGDGVASMVGGFCGGCTNTTYGESISCVGISRNASTITIFITGLIAIALSFIAPITTFLTTIPSCVMGGICIATYGFISVSGFKMIQKTDLDDMRNFFVVAVILVTGIGSMTLDINGFSLSSISVGLILGILANVICCIGKNKKN